MERGIVVKEEEKWKPPISLVALDTVGAILLGLGLAERFAGTDLVPQAFQFENYDLLMMILGGFMMVPMLLSLIGHARARARNGT